MDKERSGGREQVKAFIGRHRWLCVSLICALVLAVLLMTIGFWRSLLLFALLSVAGFFGYLMDKGGWAYVLAFFRRLFKKERI